MEPTRELADAIYRDRVLRARRMSPDERVREGLRLFDELCERTAADLRSENPGADEETIRALLVKRLEQLNGPEDHYVQTAEEVIVINLRWLSKPAPAYRREALGNFIVEHGDSIDWDHVHEAAKRDGTRALLDEIRASIPSI